MTNRLHLWMRRLLLLGMGLMIPCYLFTVGNVLAAPWTLYRRDRLLLAALTLLCAAGLLLAMRALARREAFLVRHERKILLAAALFYFIVQLLMAQALRFTPKTDAEQCFTAAQLLVDEGTFGHNERSYVYFSRCTNNLGFVYLLAALFRFFGAFGWGDRFMQAVLAASLLFTLGLLCGARVCRRMGGVRAQAAFLVLCASCLPLLYCTTELYTDAFSLAFPAMAVYCFLRVRDDERPGSRAVFALLFALVTFVGAQVRFTAVIPSIACVIALLFDRRALRAAALTVLMAAVLMAGQGLIDRETDRHIPRDVREKSALPILHYIAMGLPVQEDEGYGQYGDGGWYLFTTSFDDPQERDAALLEEIVDRVYYLRYPDRLLNMMSRKNLSTFGDGTFRLNEVIEADDYDADNAVKQVIFGRGAYRRAYYHLCTAMFMAQMLMACLACAQRIRRGDTGAAVLFVALVGAFLLLCIWETRARYFFQFQLVLLMAAAQADPVLRLRKKNAPAA